QIAQINADLRRGASEVWGEDVSSAGALLFTPMSPRGAEPPGTGSRFGISMVVSNASWFERSDGMRCYELVFLEPFLRARAWREQQLRWCARMEDPEGEDGASWKPLEERIAERLQHSLREMDA